MSPEKERTTAAAAEGGVGVLISFTPHFGSFYSTTKADRISRVHLARYFRRFLHLRQGLRQLRVIIPGRVWLVLEVGRWDRVWVFHGADTSVLEEVR